MKRHWRKIVLAVVLIWLLVIGILTAAAYADVREGRNAFKSVKRHANAASLQDGTLDNDLHHGRNALRAAHGKLANPFVQPIRIVPFVGRQFSSAMKLSGAGATAADVAIDGLAKTRRLGSSASTDRQVLLSQVSSIAGDAHRRLDGLDFGPSTGLIGPLATGRKEVAGDIIRASGGLDRASAAAGGLGSLFGQPSNYLVLAANNGEMRAGSGMFLSAGRLQAGGNALSLNDMESVGGIQAKPGSVSWPPELHSLWGWLGRENDFRNLMASPRYDVAAPLAAGVWANSSGGGRVDGVMALDPMMLRAVLQATGPVQVDGNTIDANNVVRTLAFDQYKSLTGAPGTNQQRRERLSGVAQAAFAALSKGGWDPVVLARELGHAADGRHVLMWSQDPGLNSQWQRAGIDGRLSDSSLMLSMVNVGGNKLDQFMNVDSTLSTTTGRSGQEMAVTVRMTNNAPKDGPAYVLGPFPGSGLAPGEYQAELAFNVPGDATAVRFDADPPLNVAGPDGPTKAIATKVQIKRGETKVMTLRFSRPATARFTLVEPSARVPATNWHSSSESWMDETAHTFVH